MTQDSNRIRFAKKTSGKLVWFLPIGVLLMLASLGEASLAWAALICVTGWCGLAAGLAATEGWTLHLLGHSLDAPASVAQESSGQSTGNDRRDSKWRTQLWGLFIFWGPSLAVVWMIVVVTDRLPEGQGPLGRFGPLTYFQVLSMYFCYTGATWWGVYRATR